MSAVGSIDLETENIRNLKLFLQLYFAFRNINTSKLCFSSMVPGFFPDYDLSCVVFFFPYKRTLHQFSTEQG